MNKYQQILAKYWGYPNFRPLQEDIIRSVADDKNDTLGLLPTGGGKSIIFQVPALASEGICIVVTPLIALMKDQVDNLKKRNIKATAIYSGMTKHELDVAFNNCIYGNTKFLYLSPERLNSELFIIRLQEMNVNLIAIDESHCISQWGYDFRPSYLSIAKIREYVPNVPFLALTATATIDVVDDIQEKLEFKEKNVFRKSFERKNLVYIVRNVEDKFKYLLKIATKTKGSGIVYVRNRKRTKEIANFLTENNISADFYHAGIDAKFKDYKQDQWKTGKCRIIVSTNAFGMGIDKSNVRFVVHIDLPDSLEAYFQEAGRGGRDEKTAYAVLLYNKNDKINIKKRIKNTFPERNTIKRTYNALANYYQIPVGHGKGLVYDFNIRDFAQKFKLSILQTYSCLKFLQKEAYVDITEELNNSSKVMFIVSQPELYKFQVANANFDGFVRMMLRTYSGIFSDYIKIDESFLARKTQTKLELIYNYLQKLDQLNIIKYIPQKKTPLIIFTKERLDNKNLKISKDNYEDRKNRYLNRVDAVLKYASKDNKCRSQKLLSYFGETDSYRCGQCDVCRRRNELNLSKYEFDIILIDIKKILKQSQLSVDGLIDNMNHDGKKVIKVIKWLLENDKIRYTIEKKITWV